MAGKRKAFLLYSYSLLNQSRAKDGSPLRDAGLEEVLQEARDGRALSVRAPADHGPVYSTVTDTRTGH